MSHQKGVTIWFTGLSGSGKTTIAKELEKRLKERGQRVERLDGDEVRDYLSRDLGFSKADRDENIRRVSYVANLLTRNGVITLCCFISPYKQARDNARALIGAFIEVYFNTPLEICEQRDVKGLYARARAGEIANFTAVSDPYEPPLECELIIKTDQTEVDDSVNLILSYLEQNHYL